MRKLIKILVIALMLPLFLYGEQDSVIYLRSQDTIYLKLSELQEKIIEHRIEENQTLYGLSRFYGMSLNELFDYNPKLDRNTYSVGQRLHIPVPNKSILTHIPTHHYYYDYVPLFYRVKKSDTLYRLSKNYFNIPMDTIAMMNQLTTSVLSLGQVIQVGWISRKGIPNKYRKLRGGPVDKKNQLLRRKYQQDREVKREHKEKGVAFWQGNGVKSVDLYAMHRKAPINSIIACTNPMTKKTVYAKVIARIPDSIYNKDVVVVVSSRVAKLLGAKDQRFFVKMRYLR